MQNSKMDVWDVVEHVREDINAAFGIDKDLIDVDFPDAYAARNGLGATFIIDGDLIAKDDLTDAIAPGHTLCAYSGHDGSDGRTAYTELIIDLTL